MAEDHAAKHVVSATTAAAAAAASVSETVLEVPVRSNATSRPHPYYPLGVEILGYAANDRSIPELLSVFAVGCVGIFGLAALAAKRIRPEISKTELVTIFWFVLSGCLHVFFEGFFVLNFQTIGGSNHIFGQLWKEYSLSDSRYLTQNTLVLCMESITAVIWGPLSLATAYFIATEHPLRHPFQVIISLGHLYGDVLYYATSLVEHALVGVSYSRPEPYYFWFYFVLMNAFWIVIPGVLIYNSVKACARAFKALAMIERSLKAVSEVTK
ncbi:3-beta-hydroxysteroid-Delta(8),Delta(7)-isomerase [Phyllosticta capitalensis]|uniref:3-beta-hydroxysteroid-Delta(8), Delta(7)-isomerase n=1 Tax=Phyllosticta capitalensis TaxID=121624 RepID=A0ABR1YN27_9PEZI